MIPRIIEFEEGRLKITAEAFALKEINDILVKYGDKAEPYIMYIQLRTHPTSTYVNLPVEEQIENAVYDVIQTVGDFDNEDPLIDKAIEKLLDLYMSPVIRTADELAQELHRIRLYLRDHPIKDVEELKARSGLMEKIEKVVLGYTKVRETADKEIEAKMRGKAELGEY